jgi:hypothetical protein
VFLSAFTKAVKLYCFVQDELNEKIVENLWGEIKNNQKAVACYIFGLLKLLVRV